MTKEDEPPPLHPTSPAFEQFLMVATNSAPCVLMHPHSPYRHTPAVLQVDRFLAFNALSHADMQEVFEKLLALENTVRGSLRSGNCILCCMHE